ncbi:hypothetical protein M8Z33_07405 [Streptomyces sp. ZAF1911]|uniref:hypothetical protein n=1 Tax=Streptomyces sp. ZAF1911 TaxID=2944129 RepID=UPI00237BB7AA|nr:hypothetical protein [Streptomyces sp. ZAF1911]MDD9376500.1 hypothetical protein [Streptomyces sp. ZAF1911]
MTTSPGPLITRTTAGAGHIAVALAHWAGGHTVSEEELLRRILKARAEAHAEAVEEHQREARRAHKRATKLRRIAAEDGGLVPAAQIDLTRAEHEARRHEAALDALGDWEIRDVDPGQIRHRRMRISALRCTALAFPVAGVAVGSWLLDGVVLLVSTLGAVTACWARGNVPFELTLRPVPAELLADTARLVLEPAEEDEAEPEPIEADDLGAWRQTLRRFVEHSVAQAHLERKGGVLAVDLLQRLQASRLFLDKTPDAFPAVLRSADIPVKKISVDGTKALGVQYTDLTAALKRLPQLPVHLVPDLTQKPGESKPLPHQTP